jgi:hypothetical protein
MVENLFTSDESSTFGNGIPHLATFTWGRYLSIDIAIAAQWHHSPLSNGDQSKGIYITQIMRPQIGAQICTCINRYIKMGPIKGGVPTEGHLLGFDVPSTK